MDLFNSRGNHRSHGGTPGGGSTIVFGTDGPADSAATPTPPQKASATNGGQVNGAAVPQRSAADLADMKLQVPSPLFQWSPFSYPAVSTPYSLLAARTGPPYLVLALPFSSPPNPPPPFSP